MAGVDGSGLTRPFVVTTGSNGTCLMCNKGDACDEDRWNCPVDGKPKMQCYDLPALIKPCLVMVFPG